MAAVIVVSVTAGVYSELTMVIGAWSALGHIVVPLQGHYVPYRHLKGAFGPLTNKGWGPLGPRGF